MKLSKATLTFVKYVFWTGVAAAAAAAINGLGGHVPPFAVPFIAAGLKSVATYATTEANEG